MSWDCPHQSGKGLHCERLKKTCKPLQKGCVLEGRFKLAGQSEPAGLSGEAAMKTEDRKNGMEIGGDWTVGELVIRYPRFRQRLEELGVDYCCGGKTRLDEAARRKGVPLDVLLSELRQTLGSRRTEPEAQDWNAVPIPVLADHILNTHHVYLKEQLPRLDSLLAKVQKAHRARHGARLTGLRSLFDPLRAELEAHLMKEEQILFPAIKGIDAFVAGTGKRPVIHCVSLANPIRQMEAEHDRAGNALGAMRALTGDYSLPDDACQTFAALYEELKAVEADLHEHIHLENNILFPKSLLRESEMIRTGA